MRAVRRDYRDFKTSFMLSTMANLITQPRMALVFMLLNNAMEDLIL